MGTDASGLDQLELGCHSLGAKGNETFGEFGEGVLTRKKKTREFLSEYGKAAVFTWFVSVSVFEEPVSGWGTPFLLLHRREDNWREAWSWEEGLGVLWESLVRDNRQLYSALQFTECFHLH